MQRTVSWIIINRATGNAILETFSRKYAESVNTERYEVLPAVEWLQRINGRAKQPEPAT